MRFVLAVLLILAAGPGAWAQSLDRIVRAEVLTGWRDADGLRHHAALRLRLAPGWKTYWRAPGEGGIPPRFDWSASRGLAAVAPQWPVPEVFRTNGMRSVGYGGTVTIPLEVRATRAGAPVALRARMMLGVCETICIPAEIEVSGTLAAPGADDQAIRAAWRDRPMTAAEAGAGTATCVARPIEDGLRLEVAVAAPRLSAGEAAVIETADPGVWVSQPSLRRDGGRVIAVADLVPPTAAPFALDRSGVRLTLLGGGRAIDIRGCTGR
ncbi:MAG: protein-disulfide reductase DsbD domain-containing protein [Shimia sp.]